MEKAKNKELNLSRSWKIFIPLAIFLLFSLPYPLRIGADILPFSFIFYGGLAVYASRAAHQIYRQYHWQFRSLLLIMLFCAMLAQWQVISIIVLGFGSGFGGFGSWFGATGVVPEYIGHYWFSPLIKDENILCHNIIETYLGNEFIAIRIEYEHTSWWACGG